MKNISKETQYYLTSSLNYRNHYFKEGFGIPNALKGFAQKYKDNTNKEKDNLSSNISGGSGSGGGKGGNKVENIVYGDMSGEDISHAANAYASGGILSVLGPSIEKATKIAGLNAVRKFIPPSSVGGRAAGKIGAGIASNIVSNISTQLRKLSGYDFVNQNLGNIADEQMHNIMQGYGKKSFVMPKMKKPEQTQKV